MTTRKPTTKSRLWNFVSSRRWRTVSARFAFLAKCTTSLTLDVNYQKLLLGAPGVQQHRAPVHFHSFQPELVIVWAQPQWREGGALGRPGNPVPWRWIQTFVQWREEGRWTQGEVSGRQIQDWGSFYETNLLIFLYFFFFFQSPPSCVFQFLPVRAQHQPTGDEQHPEPRHYASFCGCRWGGRCEKKHGFPHALLLLSVKPHFTHCSPSQ